MFFYVCTSCTILIIIIIPVTLLYTCTHCKIITVKIVLVTFFWGKGAKYKLGELPLVPCGCVTAVTVTGKKQPTRQRKCRPLADENDELLFKPDSHRRRHSTRAQRRVALRRRLQSSRIVDWIASILWTLSVLYGANEPISKVRMRHAVPSAAIFLPPLRP